MSLEEGDELLEPHVSAPTSKGIVLYLVSLWIPPCMFCLIIPGRSANHFRELNKATVKVHPEERQVSDFN